MTDKPRLGIYENLDEQAYHEDDALGSNDIKGLIKTKGLYNKKKYAPDSDSLRIGSAFHCLFLLGKNEFLKQYKIRKAPRVQRFWGNGKTIVSLSEFQMISDWCRNIPKSIINLRGEECTARNIMDSGAIKSVKTELSYFWINEQGVRCKVRFDMLFNDNIIVDPKTIQNWKGIDMDLCINESIAKLHYNVQAVQYLDGLNHMRKSLGLKEVECAWFWAFEESVPPFRAVAKRMPDSWIEPTQFHIKKAMENYLEAKNTGLWEDRLSDVIYTEEMPFWWRDLYNINN